MADNTATANTISGKKRVRDDSDEYGSDSSETKRIQYDLLDILDDSELGVDRDPSTQDFASVLKSFEEEIYLSPPPASDLTSVSGESQPDLGYLLEASDDELGIPPAFSSSGEEEKSEEEVDILRVSSDTVGFDQIWRFEDEIPTYGFGIEEGKDNMNSNGDFVVFEGLFNYSDAVYEQSDFSDFYWQPESLPAL